MKTQQHSVFLGGPFKALVSAETGEMREDEKARLLSLIQFFEQRGLRVFNAHRREAWGREFLTPEECTRLDFEEISSCDAFVAFPGSPPSPGTHVELGWASALRKPIVLLLEEGKEYAFLVRGLHTVSNVTSLYAKPGEDYIPRLKAVFDGLGL
ncbi:nucleoside 2-deoxyribosyltransferase [Corallococcus exiguus]|uniref:nucleoside 2-deoxyribosyltransferase n=1 Tax=Corallococcus exiguus TaxID=83462 RepID=UPI00147111A1|nr:nucleoside 2-deoxyribosyltransferase [Corallococcus exiguus]NNB94888.1 nucleoside 2-deoxyribosyltransferase [Corallococcus exiguus]NNC02617.1 nucleoside 2-deoxyribosyltransferase [Corallococcus exiguus]